MGQSYSLSSTLILDGKEVVTKPELLKEVWKTRQSKRQKSKIETSPQPLSFDQSLASNFTPQSSPHSPVE